MTWIGYPPTWAFFQAGLYKLYSFSGIDNRFVFYFIVKQPMVLADLVDGYLLYKLISDLKNVESGVRAFAFWMLCPFTIIISALWGMFDQIILVLVLGSIFTVKETQKSALMESLGFLLKVLPLIYFPVVAFVQDSRQKIAVYLSVSIGSSIVFALLPYLFFPKWKLSQLVSVGVSVANKLGGSMNYWIILTVYGDYWKIPALVNNMLNYLAYLWVPSVLVSSAICIKNIRGRENLTRNVCLSLLFVTVVFYLTKSIVNEQYPDLFSGSWAGRLLCHGVQKTVEALQRYLVNCSCISRRKQHLLYQISGTTFELLQSSRCHVSNWTICGAEKPDHVGQRPPVYCAFILLLCFAVPRYPEDWRTSAS